MKSSSDQMNRRRFLQLAGNSAVIAGFPTIIPSRVLGAAAPGGLIQIAVIGCGRIARGMDLRGALRHPDLVRVVAVADVDAKRAELAKEMVEQSYSKSLSQTVKVIATTNYQELIARDDIDAVMICTPDHWHSQPVLEAALAGKDIYVQKPLSMTIAEGRLVSDVVAARQRILQIGSQQRSTSQFHRACELVRNGVIGSVRSVQIGLPTDPAGGDATQMPVPEGLDFDQWLGCTPEEPYTVDRVHPPSGFSRPCWLRLNAYTCGMITGWGSHHVDIAHWGIGAEYGGPLSVDATATWPGEDSFWNVHGKYKIRMVYPNDVSVTISDTFPNGIRFEGEDGWIWVTRGKANSSKAFNASDPKLPQVPESELTTKLHRSPGWDHHLDWFEAMRNRKPATTNAETGHRACSACCISWIGMKLSRPLKWDPEKEQFDLHEANQMRHRMERAPYGAFLAANKAGFNDFKSLRS